MTSRVYSRGGRSTAPRETRTCLCPCNQTFECYITSLRKYKHGANCRRVHLVLMVESGCLPPDNWRKCSVCGDDVPLWDSVSYWHKRRKTCHHWQNDKDCSRKAKAFGSKRGGHSRLGKKNKLRIVSKNKEFRQDYCMRESTFGVDVCEKYNSECAFLSDFDPWPREIELYHRKKTKGHTPSECYTPPNKIRCVANYQSNSNQTHIINKRR